MSDIKHADIIPLIGGLPIACEQAFGSRPEYLMSWSPFWNNDQHIVNYYDNEVPYVRLDEEGHKRPRGKIDVVSSTCPCAGLSLLSTSSSPDNAKNEWMYTAATYVLGNVKPQVYFGENAPQLAGKLGGPVRKRLQEIGLEHGYSFSLYTTKSLLHGVPQVRARSFYFFWKGDKVPILSYYATPYPRIEELLLGTKGNSQTEPINKGTPSRDDPLYRYILEELHGGIGHKEFVAQLEIERARNTTVSFLQNKHDGDWRPVRDWLKKQAKGQEDDKQYLREAERCDYRMSKLADGKGFMAWGTCWPKGYIGAFVGHLPHSLTHPTEDRYISFREAMTIMGLPPSFELLGGRKNTNHICQNVPVQTARDLALEVRAVIEGKRERVKSQGLMIQHNASRTIEWERDEHRAPRGSLTEAFA